MTEPYKGMPELFKGAISEVTMPYKGFLPSMCVFCGAAHVEGFACDLIGAQDDPISTVINPDAKGFVLCRDVCGSPECRKYACSFGEVRLRLIYPAWSDSEFDLAGARARSYHLDSALTANKKYADEIKKGSYDYLLGLKERQK